MSTSLKHTLTLKHTLNPGFALLFAVGVERLYKVVDPVVLHKDPAVSVLTQDFYMPLTMVLLTLLFGSLSSIANDQFVEAKVAARQEVSATSLVAWLSYSSVLCVLWMFYFSVDLAFIGYWWFGYAVLCVVNAVWNWFAIQPPSLTRHVIINIIVAALLIIILGVSPSILSIPLWFYVLLLIIGCLKVLYQRRLRRNYVKI
jgi:hypothetical protein